MIKKLPEHLLQSRVWGEFKTAVGNKAVVAGKVQYTLHPVPFTNFFVGYAPKVYPQDIDWSILYESGKRENCIFIKIEPNASSFEPPKNFPVRMGKRLFSYHTVILDLLKPEEELLSKMHSKTRYNIRLALKKGVKTEIRTDEGGLEIFLGLQRETAKRQKFFIHPDYYYRKAWELFTKNNMAYIIIGSWEDKPLVAYMFVIYKKTLFYPYGGSSREHPEVMAPYAVMWEGIKLGKRLGCRQFDMWNCLSPDADYSSPWYGFHRFKIGFGGEIVSLPGAYDLIMNMPLYHLFNLSNKLRWFFLYFKQRINNVRCCIG
jgi:lipid II:glycine glycyltransferase (peptidoglycan interpeptide bridge formation enzyme)